MKRLDKIMAKLPWWSFLFPAVLFNSVHTNSVIVNFVCSVTGNVLVFSAGILYVLQNRPYTNEEVLEKLAELKETQEAYNQGIAALEMARQKYEVFNGRLN